MLAVKNHLERWSMCRLTLGTPGIPTVFPCVIIFSVDLSNPWMAAA